jgi:hypothetical protein
MAGAENVPEEIAKAVRPEGAGGAAKLPKAKLVLSRVGTDPPSVRVAVRGKLNDIQRQVVDSLEMQPEVDVFNVRSRYISDPHELARVRYELIKNDIVEIPTNVNRQELLSRLQIEMEQLKPTTVEAPKPVAPEVAVVPKAGTLPTRKFPTTPRTTLPEAPISPAEARPMQGVQAGGRVPPEFGGGQGLPPLRLDEPFETALKGAEAPPPSGVDVPPWNNMGNGLEPGGVPIGAWADTDTALRQAGEIVRQDKAGAISALFDKIPGLKPVRGFEKPIRNMSDSMATAIIARQGTGARLTQLMAPSQGAFIRRIRASFNVGGRGLEASHGGITGIKFTGTAEQQIQGLTGTLLDVFQRPKLYDLNREQRALVREFGSRNDDMLRVVNDAYGTEIGRFDIDGGVYLPNKDISKSALAGGKTETQVISRGSSKTRFYQTAFDRMKADPAFEPELDVEKLIWSMDNHKATTAADVVFKQGLGGRTKLELMEELHPRLYDRMTGLRKKVQSLKGTAGRLENKVVEAVDAFLSSPIDDMDLITLRDSLDVQITRGPRTGMTVAAAKSEIAKIRAEIRALQPAWKAANTRGYDMVPGIWRYFPSEDAQKLNQYLTPSNNPLFKFLDELRGTAFAGDFSPITGIQAPISALFAPYASFKQGLGGAIKAGKTGDILRSFRAAALQEDVLANPQWWGDFAFYIQRAAGTRTPKEFSGGLLRFIPGFTKANESMYVGTMRLMERGFEDSARTLLKAGFTEDVAKVAAADQASKVIPLISTARLGQSQSRAAMFRAIPSSISFIRKPSEMVMDATRGYVKLGLKQTLTPRERLAVRLMTTFAGTTLSISVTTNVLTALKQGLDPERAALDAMSPTSSKFMAINFPGGSLPIGGPYRGIIKAITPREVSGVPVPVPFAGFPNYASNRLNPGLRTAYDLARNKDFFGNTIYKGNALESTLRGVAYLMEGLAPLTAGSVIESKRVGYTAKQTALEAAAQFAGTNLRQATPFQERDVLVERWAQDNQVMNKEGTGLATSFFEMAPSDQDRFEQEFSKETEAILQERERRAALGDPVARRQVLVEEVDDTRIRFEQEIVDELSQARSTKTVPEGFDSWRAYMTHFEDTIGERMAEAASNKKQIYRDFDVFQEGTLPEEPNARALAQYYQAFDLAVRPGGKLDWDALDSVMAYYEKKWTEAQKTYVETNTGLTKHPPLVEAFLAGRKAISESGYRDLEEGQPRLRFRKENPSIDALLVLWYAYKPQTELGRRLYDKLYGDERVKVNLESIRAQFVRDESGRAQEVVITRGE